MKVSKFKLAFIVLLIATMAWGIAFCYTRLEYYKYLEWIESDECPLMEKLKYMWDGIGVWQDQFGGRYIYGTAPFLLIAWIGFIAVAIGKLSERKKPTVESVGGASPPSPN